jgi:hypothetical protein
MKQLLIQIIIILVKRFILLFTIKLNAMAWVRKRTILFLTIIKLIYIFYSYVV